MPGEVDPRLIGFLHAAIAFADALRDIGIAPDVRVDLDRAGGLALLGVVSGVDDPLAEERARQNVHNMLGRNTLKAAGIVFSWPQAGAVSARHPPAPANDNRGGFPSQLRWGGFEEETPALR